MYPIHLRITNYALCNYLVNSNRQINELYVGLGGSWQYANLTQLAGGPPAVGAISGYAWEGGNGKQVTYVSSNGHINELYVSKGGKWQYADLTQLSLNRLR